MSRIISFGKSDVGLRRSNNEDALVLKPELSLWAVADGMGGAAAGEVDSRTCRLRQGRMRQLARDHSLVQDQIDQGLITQVEAKKHSLRNVILRAVGVEESLAVDLLRGKRMDGDLFLS